MQTETVMASAMKKAGFNKVEAEIRVALSRWTNKGVSKQRLHELIDELPDEGRLTRADKASLQMPSVRQPNGDGKAGDAALQGPSNTAALSPPHRDGPGLSRPAETGPMSFARPAREPNAIHIAAAARARAVAAKAIFTVNGIDIRQFTLGACKTERRRKGKEHYVLSIIVGQLKHLPDTTKVGDQISDAELMSIVRQGEAYANAA